MIRLKRAWGYRTLRTTVVYRTLGRVALLEPCFCVIVLLCQPQAASELEQRWWQCRLNCDHTHDCTVTKLPACLCHWQCQWG